MNKRLILTSAKKEKELNGKIDQFRVFNSALTSTQVSELYNEVVCN